MPKKFTPVRLVNGEVRAEYFFPRGPNIVIIIEKLKKSFYVKSLF